MKVFLIVGVLIFIVGITFEILIGNIVDEGVAVRALENQGFRNVRVTDRDTVLVSFRGCSEKDVVKFDMEGINSLGKQVEMFVCVGWPFKGATIRNK